MGGRKMEKNQKEDEDAKLAAPWDKADLITKYSLSFVLPLIKLAWRNQLHLQDLPKTPSGDLSSVLGERLERSYLAECDSEAQESRPPPPSANSSGENGANQAKETSKDMRQGQRNAGRRRAPSLMRALFKTFGFELLAANLFNTFTRMVLFPLQTVALGWLLADIRRYSNLKTIADVFVDQVELASSHDQKGTETGANSTGTFYAHEAQSNGQPPRNDIDSEERAQIYSRILSQLCILIATTCLASCLLHPFYFQTYHLGMKCRVAVCHLIYKKALRLSQQALVDASAGQLINLLSNDVNRFDRVVETIPFLVDGPMQVILVTIILSKFYLGFWPTLSGLLVVLAFMLLQGASGRLFSRFRARAAERTDERVRLMSEICQSIRVLKMYAWERVFAKRVLEARQREMRALRNTFMVRLVNQTLFFMSSKIIVFAMLMVYVLLDYGPLDPELVFVTIGLSNLMRVTISMYLANAVAQCAETLISCRRIDSFLQLPELKHQSANQLNPSRQQHAPLASRLAHEPAVKFERAYAWWRTKEHMALRNLSLAIEPGQLVLLVGRVGSGKSSVLLSVLGELELASGRLELTGRLSYAGQEAWLFAGSVRDNILFGEPLDPKRYQEVVRVCCLERDFEQLLAHGDQTQVGERGAALSGGQRARVQLARALFRRADIYLLDDPLAALDAPVAQHIVRECLKSRQANGFLAGKTILLASHQLELIKEADKVLLLDQQAPAMFGTASDILNSDKFKLIDFGRHAFEGAAAGKQADGGSSEQSGPDETAAEHSSERPTTTAPPTSGRESDVDQQKKHCERDSSCAVAAATGWREQELDCGVASDGQTYWFYLAHSFKWAAFVWFAAIGVAAQLAYLWIDFMVSRWTEAREQLDTLGDQLFKPQLFIDAWRLDEMAAYYAASILCGLLLVGLLCLSHLLASLRASRRIHARCLARLLRGQMVYFERTPIGLLLNRLSRDLGFVDQTLPLSALDILLIFSNIFAAISLTVLINPYNSLVALGLLSIALLLRSASLRAITRLKQLEGITRSPVFSHLSATLNGLATIRAFEAQASFRLQFDAHQDGHSSAWFAFVCTTRWLGQSMDWASVSFVSIVLTSVIVSESDTKTAGLIGLLISHAVYMPGAFQAAMRQLVEAESQMTSVQRLKELCELPMEDEGRGAHSDAPNADRDDPLQLASKSDKTRATRPASLAPPAICPVGCIKLVDVTLRHNSRPVLEALNLLIRPRERVGIVGRTGAGKSSLVGVLFRLYPFEGRVELDGRDTRSLSLQELRNSISIIPQEPVLFAGSLRLNLDPFGRRSDAELWAALEAVQLAASLFARHPEGLEFSVNETGANFSVGQRQLICLARAIVRKSKILVLDEATASVDIETDRLIQAAIKKQFAHCTVLTIAHRLQTIADSDRVLVIERGRAVEFGEPLELLQNEQGAFARMLAHSGQQQAAQVRRLIELAHEHKSAS